MIDVPMLWKNVKTLPQKSKPRVAMFYVGFMIDFILVFSLDGLSTSINISSKN